MVIIVFILVSLALIYAYKKLFPRIIVDITPSLGKWTVVTGATDGIGKSFSHELAGKGFNVVLLSRSADKLEAAAKEIENKFNVSTKIIQADFTSLDEHMFAKIEADLKNLEIGVLVNCVGTHGSPYPEYFLDLEKHNSSLYQNTINCNVSTVVNMTRVVLPGMVNRGTGLIINISSGLSIFPSPLYAMYGATKSFVTKFSQDLDIEYREKGVHTHVLTTGVVTTKLSGAKKGSFFPPSPQIYAKSALAAVARNRICDGHIAHSITSIVLRLGMLLCPTYTATLLLKQLGNVRNQQIQLSKECS